MGDKRTSKQIEFHHGKGGMGGEPGGTELGGFEWSFDRFSFLIRGVKLLVWLLISRNTHIFCPCAAFLACFFLHERKKKEGSG